MKDLKKIKKRITDFVSSQHFQSVDVNAFPESDIIFFEERKKDLIKQNYSSHQAYKMALEQTIEKTILEEEQKE